MLDLDDFKKINDNLGHITGDKVLREVAEIIRGSLRKNDIAGRYGGEEFLIIFPQTSIKDASEVCENIRRKVESKYQSSNIKLTISGGLAVYKEGNAHHLIDQADAKLYEAKNSGKNKILF